MKKKKKAMSCLNVFKRLCFSLFYFVLFLVFLPPSLILALESGKKRVVVVVVVATLALDGVLPPVTSHTAV